MTETVNQITPDDELLVWPELLGESVAWGFCLAGDWTMRVFKSPNGDLYWDKVGKFDGMLYYQTREAAELAAALIDIMEIRSGPSH